MIFRPKDYYFWKAKETHYVARSVFKLQEIDQHFHIFKPGDQVLDLGAAPGSWSQYACKKIAPSGKLLGIDLNPILIQLNHAVFVQADLYQIHHDFFIEKGFTNPFQVVLSDMAPKTTGIKWTDQAQSLELCQLALKTAQQVLQQRGHFICKLFQGEEFTNFKNQLKKNFKKVEIFKPQSSRKQSKEIFFIALCFDPSEKI